MRRQDYLRPLLEDRPDRVGRDRLEILTALIGSPSFDPLFRDDIITIPGGHSIYRWQCVVAACERTRTGGSDLCCQHQQEWAAASAQGTGRAAFVAEALGLERHVGTEEVLCRICVTRSAAHLELRLCQQHLSRWSYHQKTRGGEADFAEWASQEQPFGGYGPCIVAVCPNLAESPLGLCPWHSSRYRRDGNPGGAVLREKWWKERDEHEEPAPVSYAGQAGFRRWCETVQAQPWPGQVNLRGLRPLARAEIQWGLFIHTQRERPTRRDIGWIRSLAATCREQDAGSLIDLQLGDCGTQQTRAIVKEILHELRLVYFTPDEAKQAGFLETEHFGVLFPHRMSHIDLTGIPQRWLRDLAWDYIAGLLRSPGCPRSASPVDDLRRAATELGTFLDLEAPGGGHDPAVLRRGHMDRFVADQRHREREGLPSLAVTRPGGAASTVTVTTRSIVFNYARKLLRDALENGAADRLGLDREFIIAIPTAGATTGRTPRRPFSDEVARALADEANLAELSAKYDVNDGGVRDIWEATVITGRRIGEVIKLRWDCIGRYGGLAMFWHDQTKVGNYDAAIRIPERLYGRLAERQCKTLDRFTARYGYRPDGEQRARLALFPTIYRSQDGTVPLTHQWFYSRFRPWVDEMDLGHCVPHQARHTLATNLLRNGATLTHIRRYLGQVSDRMAEHYVNICPTLTSKTSCSRSGSPVPARPIPGSCWPAKPPRSAGNRPSPWRSTCPGAAPRPRAGSAPSSPSSTEVPVRGI